MGVISIDIGGSFSPQLAKDFSAMRGGHAQAVADAIKWLAETVLPCAIRQDHRLHAEGAFPENCFGLEK